MARLEVDCWLRYPTGVQVELRCAVDRPVVGLLGPSGSGKTTLLSMIAGLRRPDAGRIVCQDQVYFDSTAQIHLPPERRHVGYVVQESLLFPHLSMRDNLLYGRRRRGAQPRCEFEEVVGRLELTDLLNRLPHTLSGGQQRRAAIGRAVLSEPRLLLLDEPLNSLDEDRGEAVLALFEYVLSRLDATVVYVTHAPQELQRFNAEVIELKSQGNMMETNG